MRLCPLQLSCIYPLSPLSSAQACGNCLHIASKRLFQNISVGSLNDKKLPCAGQGQELSVNIAVSPVPELPLHKFYLCAIRRNRRKDTLEKPILWIFHDLPVIRPNQTAREMMLRIEILMKCRGSIFPSTQGQERLGRRLGINALILPNYLAPSRARVADSKASKSGSSTDLHWGDSRGGSEFNLALLKTF